MTKKTLTLILFLLVLLPTVLITAQHRTQVELTPTPPPTLPDLVVNSVKFTLDPTKSCLVVGMPLGTQVVIVNQGTDPLLADAQFEIAVTLNNQTVTRAVNGPLAINASLSVWLDNTGTSFQPIEVTVDSSNRIRETNENNNTWSGQLPIPTPYVSCTATPTVTPSITPNATATYVVEEGFQNGDFENASSPRSLRDWTLLNPLRTDRQVCNVAWQGACSFRFSGRSVNGTRILTQQFSLFNVQSGQAFTFNGQVQTIGLTGDVRIRVTLYYFNSRQRFVYRIPEGTTNGFQPFEYSMTFRESGFSAQIELIAGQSAGSVWFDGLTFR